MLKNPPLCHPRFSVMSTRTMSRELYHAHDAQEKKVWACLLTNEGYLRGVLTLYYSLYKTGTKYPFYVIYTDVSCQTRGGAEIRHLNNARWMCFLSGRFRHCISQ